MASDTRHFPAFHRLLNCAYWQFSSVCLGLAQELLVVWQGGGIWASKARVLHSSERVKNATLQEFKKFKARTMSNRVPWHGNGWRGSIHSLSKTSGFCPLRCKQATPGWEYCSALPSLPAAPMGSCR